MALYEEEVAARIWRNGEIVPWEAATIHVNSVEDTFVVGSFEGIKKYWNEKR